MAQARVKPPDTIKLGSRKITVRMIPAVFDDIAEQPGLSQSHERVIMLCSATVPDTQRETMLHELLHQALHLAGLTVAHDDVEADIATELEERTVIRLTPILLGVLRENPRLLSFLLEKD